MFSFCMEVGGGEFFRMGVFEFFYALEFYGGFYVRRIFFVLMRLIFLWHVPNFVALWYLTFFNAWPQDTTSWTINQLSLCHFGGCHFIPLYALIL